MNFPPRLARLLYGVIVFLAAFLLFVVEPMAAKRLLPALGGSSAVWITCLVFFQTVLLLGYLYAHALSRWLRPVQVAGVHGGLLGIASAPLVLLPLPTLAGAAAHPLTAIFFALSSTIGLPFLLLAATSPLLQVLYARQQESPVPWRFFALSNAGSLLALLLYPALIEPRFSLPMQRALWICGFGLCTVLCACLVWYLRNSTPADLPANAAPNPAPNFAITPAPPAPGPALRVRLLWFLLPAAGATQLCAVTEHISQNIAAVPLLWILPLAVYLITFILAFDAPRLYHRSIVIRLLIVLLAALAWFLTKTGVSLPILLNLGFFLAEMFLACWFCHAETYALRPADPAHTTLFYLFIAAGGAAGSIFIGIVCPLLFDANYDIALAFFATAAVALAATWTGGWQPRVLWGSSTAVIFVVVIMLHLADARCLLEERNFYGALRVTETHTPPEALTARTLTHGTITHGMQWFAPDFRTTPTTYYADDSGIGIALRLCCQLPDGLLRPRRIGVVGLGAGTIAAYGLHGDTMRFYEINPAVPPIAQNLFTFLRDSGAQISIVSGDARLSLAADAPQRFDILAIDAFSGDAIPMHLLTTQAMRIYQRQLAPGGILAFHVSNQYLDLAPEIALLAASAGMTARLVDTPARDEVGEYRAQWVLVTKNAAFLAQPALLAMAQPIPPRSRLRVWTDDDSSLLPILRWQLRPQS
jgi:hypothetical protein